MWYSLKLTEALSEKWKFFTICVSIRGMVSYFVCFYQNHYILNAGDQRH